MYEALRDLDPQFLLPGCDRVEPDSVVPLATDPGVVEAFMVGLNHEMSRELLWREYPGDERGTPFLVFWPRSGSAAGERHRPDAPAPQVGAGQPDRHPLLDGRRRGTRRARARRAVRPLPGHDRLPHPLHDTRRGGQRAGPAGVPRAVDAGHDVLRVRRPRRPARRRHAGSSSSSSRPTEPRFGLDASTATGRDVRTIASWEDLSWGDLADDDDELAALTHVPLGGRLAGRRIGPIGWGANGGHMAAVTLQRSFRIARPLRQLVP